MGSRKILTTKDKIAAVRKEYQEAKQAGELGRATRLLTQLNNMQEENPVPEDPEE